MNQGKQLPPIDLHRFVSELTSWKYRYTDDLGILGAAMLHLLEADKSHWPEGLSKVHDALRLHPYRPIHKRLMLVRAPLIAVLCLCAGYALWSNGLLLKIVLAAAGALVVLEGVEYILLRRAAAEWEELPYELGGSPLNRGLDDDGDGPD